MTGSLRAGVMTGEQWVFEERTTDPATTLEGERWLRTDLAPETNQIATLRVDVGSSVVDVPVFATGTSESGVDEALRVRVGGQDGYIPITSPGDATFNNLRMQHAGSTLAYHDRVAPGSAIPDSVIAQYDAEEESTTGSITTINNQLSGSYDLSGSANVIDNGINGNRTYRFDGVNDIMEHTESMATSDPFAFICSVQQQEATDSGNIYFDGGSNLEFGLQDFGPARGIRGGGLDSVSSAFLDTDAHILTVEAINGNEWRVRYDGANIDTISNLNASDLTGLVLADQFDTGSKIEIDYGQIEILSSYTTSERDNTESRLASKWGITL